MVHPITDAALTEFERRLQEAREAKLQIEAEIDGSRRHSGWEEPEKVLPILLNDLHDILLVALEVAGLHETRKGLIEQWQEFQARGGIGKTTFHRQHDYLESKPFNYLETLIQGLRVSFSQTAKPFETFELEKLETILRKTSTLLHRRNVKPQREKDVQNVMHDYLGAVFSQYVHPVHLTGIIRGFQPDGGIKNLKAAIEFKFAASKADVALALGGVFEDISGYKSSDWTRFYMVLYQTEPFESEDRFKSEISRVGAITWTTILVTGAGARKRRQGRAHKILKKGV